MENTHAVGAVDPIHATDPGEVRLRGEGDPPGALDAQPYDEPPDAYDAVLRWLRGEPEPPATVATKPREERSGSTRGKMPADRERAPTGLLASVAGLPDHWLAVPVDPRTKRPMLKEWTRPGVARPLADRTALADWLARPCTALAVLCGPESGVLVVDMDAAGTTHAADGTAALAALEDELGPLPATAESRTPSGGRHLWFTWPAGRRRIPSKPIRPGVDVRANAALASMPLGARTPGRTWTRHPADGLAQLPVRWLARLLPAPPVPIRRAPVFVTGDAYGRKALEGLAGEVQAAAPGTRNATLAKVAWRTCRLIQDGRLDRSALDVIAEAGLAVGLDRLEVRAALQGAARKHGLTWRGTA